MKIAICLIVYNGKPFIDLWLNHYLNCPSIDYVCVAEGATRNMMTALDLPSVRSNDGTMESMFNNYGNSKILCVAANTPHPEKNEQMNAAIGLVPDDTDYLIISGVDEFYHHFDLQWLKGELADKGYTYAEFRHFHFWKHADVIGVGGRGYGYNMPADSVFRYWPGSRMTKHRPLTMTDHQGRPLKSLKPLLAGSNPVMNYHYSYVTEKMVYEKMLYYTITMRHDYMPWYWQCWKAWTRENRQDIESRWSIHPSVPGATTRDISLVHPINTALL